MPAYPQQAWLLAGVAMDQGRLTSDTHMLEIENATAHYDATALRLVSKPAAMHAGNPRTWTFDKLRREAPQLLETMRREEPDRLKALKDLHVAEIRAKGQKKPGRA